jgi:hypothetical protein
VLKKVGIVAAAATAGVLALSPLAFAQGYEGGRGDRDRDHSSETNAFGFRDGSVERNQVNLCSFDQDSTVTPALVGPILPLISQDQNNNCANVGDGSEYAPEAEVIPPLAPVVPIVPVVPVVPVVPAG